MNPHFHRKLTIFKTHKRGWFSLWIFSILFILSLGAEFIANDRPLLVSYEDKLYYPVFKNYMETEFGGEFPIYADFKDPTLETAIQEKGWLLWPPVRFSYNTINYQLSSFPAPPSLANPLGSDDQGRDILARIIYGFRLSVLFGLSLSIISSLVGITAGAIQGYYGGWIDLGFQRFMEIWSGIPVLYLLIILSAVITMGFWSLLAVMLLFSWMGLVHVVRAEFLRCRKLDYVRSARALGVSDAAIIFKHILPNAVVATISYLPFIFSGAIASLTSLDFLGFGLPLGSPSLGELLSQGKNNLQAPWIGLSAFFVLGGLLCLLVFIGEAFRDAMDPHGRRRR